MSFKFKKGDKVVWRVTSGFCIQEYNGEIGRAGKLNRRALAVQRFPGIRRGWGE